MALAVASFCEAVVAGAVFRARSEQIAQLALERAAYAIPDVARYGRSCNRERKRLAAWLAEVVADARLPGSLYLADRVARFGRDLDRLASDLATSAAIDPVSAVACRRLLTHAVDSPLYNERLPAEDLLVVLQRIRAGIQTA